MTATRQLLRALFRTMPALLLLLGALPARAAVTITFWSHELGNSFPHAFVTLRGTPDRGGQPVDMNIGFTAKHISPAILFGKVAGMLEGADLGYLKGSDAQFSMVLSDAQYAEVLRVLDEYGPTGNQTYDLNHRNCVTFVQVIAARLGLAGTDQPKLIKRPRSFLVAVAAANEGHVTPIAAHGKDYVATLVPVPGVDPARPILAATATPTAATAFVVPATPGDVAAAPTPSITAESMSEHGKVPPPPAATGAPGQATAASTATPAPAHP